MTDEHPRDREPFKHLTDDELMAGNKVADARYCAVVVREFPLDRESLAQWIVEVGELSAVNHAYYDEWRRRREIRHGIIHPEPVDAMEVTAETPDGELDAFLFGDDDDPKQSRPTVAHRSECLGQRLSGRCPVSGLRAHRTP